MNGWIDDILRWLRELVNNEALAHSIRHMGLHSFQHFVQHNLPHLWETFKEYIAEIFGLVMEWLSNMS